MKNRILSLVLALTMMLSVASFSVVSAAEVEVNGGSTITAATEVNYNTDYVVSMEAKDETQYFSFTTISDEAFYTIDFGNYTGSTKHFYLCTKAGKELKRYTYVGAPSSDKSFHLKLDTNETYYLKIYNTNDEVGNCGFSISYKKDPISDTVENAMPISVNRKYEYEGDGEGDLDFFSFVPTESKKYYVTFANATGSNKHVYILDANEQEIGRYTYLSESRSKTLECDMVEEETYYIKISSPSVEGGKYSIIVEDSKECEHARTSRNNKATEYEEIRGDDNYHYIIKYYDEICDECKETVKSRVQESKYTERHNFSGSYCTSCDYEKEEEPVKDEPIYTPPTTTVPAPVEDVIDGKTSFGSKVSTWAEKEIEEAYDEGLIPEVLTGDDLTQKVDRAEFAAIAVQLYETLSDKKVSGYSSTPFNDIYSSDCYIEIIKAYFLNITDGTSLTTFEPNKLITREQLATMLCRAIKKYSDSSWSLANDSSYYLDTSGVKKFADDADISAYAKQSVYFMAKLGVIKGVSSTHFAPKNTTSYQEATGYAMATREQAIAMSLRIFNISDMLK